MIILDIILVIAVNLLAWTNIKQAKKIKALESANKLRINDINSLQRNQNVIVSSFKELHRIIRRYDKSAKSSSESTVETKRKGRSKKKEEGTIKGIGLFDHIKHIRTIQDPNYFKNLTDLDKKTFSHFMILKALSMNPALLSDISDLFKYFDKVPSPQFYQLLIGLIPIDRNYYPWVKPPKSQVSDSVIELISKYFEISKLEAKDYALLLLTKPDGIKELENFCRDYGMDDREIKKMFENKEEKE